MLLNLLELPLLPLLLFSLLKRESLWIFDGLSFKIVDVERLGINNGDDDDDDDDDDDMDDVDVDAVGGGGGGGGGGVYWTTTISEPWCSRHLIGLPTGIGYPREIIPVFTPHVAWKYLIYKKYTIMLDSAFLIISVSLPTIHTWCN